MKFPMFNFRKNTFVHPTVTPVFSTRTPINIRAVLRTAWNNEICLYGFTDRCLTYQIVSDLNVCIRWSYF